MTTERPTAGRPNPAAGPTPTVRRVDLWGNETDTNRTEAELNGFTPSGKDAMSSNLDIVIQAARAVLQSVDWEASSYEAQHPAEDWALDALDAAINGRTSDARKLLRRYSDAPWSRECEVNGRWYRAEYEQ